LLTGEEEEEKEEFICQHVGWRQSKVIIADAGGKGNELFSSSSCLNFLFPQSKSFELCRIASIHELLPILLLVLFWARSQRANVRSPFGRVEEKKKRGRKQNKK